MIGFLPFILVFILIIVLYAVQGYAQTKGLKLVLLGFFMILLASTIIYYFLPESKAVKHHFLTEQGDLAHQKIDLLAFREEIIAGNIDEVKDVYLKKQWIFDYNGATLEIPDTDNPDPHIFVERKEADDGKVEVLQYYTKLLIGGIDFSKKIKPLEVALSGNTLSISAPERTEIQISGFKKDFVISQFNREETREDLTVPAEGRNFLQIVYIKIPKNMELPVVRGMQFVNSKHR